MSDAELLTKKAALGRRRLDDCEAATVVKVHLQRQQRKWSRAGRVKCEKELYGLSLLLGALLSCLQGKRLSGVDVSTTARLLL
jgi:hypothetical protein